MRTARDRPSHEALRVVDAWRHEELLRACWRFRLTLIDLQPHVGLEADWQAFRAYFRPGVQLVVWRRRGDGAIGAMIAWSLRRVYDGARAHVVLDADYGFVAPELRRRVAVMTLPRIWLRAALAGRSFTVTLVGSGYPTGVMSFGRVARRIRSLGDRDLEPWERQILREHCVTADCIDGERGVVRMRTCPREPRRRPRSARSRALLAWYEAQVPRWLDGLGLAYIVRFEPKDLLCSWLFGHLT